MYAKKETGIILARVGRGELLSVWATVGRGFTMIFMKMEIAGVHYVHKKAT